MDDNWFQQVSGGPLGAFDLTYSLWAIQDFLGIIHAERERLAENLEAQPDSDDSGDLYADRAHSLAFVEVACSQAAVGAIAPLAEAVMKRSANRLREKFEKPLDANSHHRAHLPDDKFWNPSLLEKGGNTEINLLGGFRQLLKALRLSGRISKGCWSTLEALFAFRNAALHEGYEWPIERRNTFFQDSQQRSWDWFEVTTIDGEPWLVSAKVEFWSSAITQIEEVARVISDVCLDKSP